ITQTAPVSTLGKTGVTLKFWYLCEGEASSDYGQVYYSNDGGFNWFPIGNALSGVSNWTEITFQNPGFDNKASLAFRFKWINDANSAGTDPAFAIDEFRLEAPANTNSITVSNLSSLTYCPGDPISVSYTITGTLSPGNQFTIELSDANGSFANPTVIGTVSSTANTGTLNGTIPAGTPSGTGYRVRVVSSNPVIIGSDNGANITINSAVAPNVSFPVNIMTICSGNTVTFTPSVNPANGNYTYTWALNGTIIPGLNLPSLTTNAITSNSTVTVTVTPLSGCVTTPASASVQVQVENPVVSAQVSPNQPVSGGSVTLTGSVSGASGGQYQWTVTDSITQSSVILNGAIVTLNTVIGPQPYTYELVYISPNGCLDTLTETFYVSGTVSLEKEIHSAIRCYPNPTQEYLFIDYPPSPAIRISIRDINGKEVTIPYQVENNRISVPVHSLSQGIYWIQLQDDTKLFSNS
ncbi:MAG: T9SS type A sorting domain-containing protein, partial [Bacteroidia bacterium]|nr:T9SS type A sorting domain-containing protein [Bacteroidia bacterium]